MKYNEIQFLRPDPFLTEGITFLRHDPDGHLISSSPSAQHPAPSIQHPAPSVVKISPLLFLLGIDAV